MTNSPNATRTRPHALQVRNGEHSSNLNGEQGVEMQNCGTDKTCLTSIAQGIVDDAPLTNTNTLVDKRTYSRVGSNSLLDVDPGVLHFGGFRVGNTQTRIVRIRNAAGFSTRVHVLPPNSPYFQMSWRRHHGYVAPGMCEELEIEFLPKEWRYYYDCIRVHSEDENLIVPIHAYPVMNETKFPERVCFGTCPIGDTVEKIVKMSCKVPIDFDFKIEVVKGNPSFSLHPLQGRVPANGEAPIFISFTPDRYSTESMEIHVVVLDFNAQPILCQITGSAMPGMHATLAENEEQCGNSTPADTDNNAKFLKAGSKGGSGCGDAYTRYKTQRRKKATEGQKESRPTRCPGPKTPDQLLESHQAPRQLSTHGGIAHILNRQDGKLGIGDVKTAIEVRKKELAEKDEELDATIQRGRSQGVDPLDDPNIPHTIKEAIFRRQLDEAAKRRRKIEMTKCVALGERPMAAEEIEQLKKAKSDALNSHKAEQDLLATKRFQPELREEGAVHHLDPDAEENVLLRTFKPDFNENKRDDWVKRTTAFERFVTAGRIVLIRARVQKRLDKIRNLLSALDYDKSKVAAEVENPLLTKVVGGAEDSFDLSSALCASKIRSWPFPKYDETRFFDLGAVKPAHYKDYSELREHDLKVPLKYKLLGYEEETSPELEYYMPPLKDQPLMSGAEEDSVEVVPCGLVKDIGEIESMPEAFTTFPFSRFEIQDRYSIEKVFKSPPPAWGFDSRYPIQPTIYEFTDSTKTEDIASNSLRAYQGWPTVFDKWRPKTQIPKVIEDCEPPMLNGPDASDLNFGSLRETPLQIDPDKIDDMVQDMCGVLGVAGDIPLPERLPWQEQIDELNSKVAAARKEAIDSHQQSVQEFNRNLKKPYMHAIK